MKIKRKRHSHVVGFFPKEDKHFSLNLTQKITPKEFTTLYTKLKKNTINSMELIGDAWGVYSESVLKAISLAAKVEEIDLDTTLIGDEGIKLLQDLLKSNKCLKKLGLSSTELSDEQVEVLSEGLIENTTLTQLDLSSNKITESGMVALNHALEKNNTLTVLNLNYNYLGDKGILAFCPTLRSNKKLEKLNIRQCDISDKGLEGIIGALGENPDTLKTLDMSNNEILNKANVTSGKLPPDLEINLLSENEYEICSQPVSTQ